MIRDKIKTAEERRLLWVSIGLPGYHIEKTREKKISCEDSNILCA